MPTLVKQNVLQCHSLEGALEVGQSLRSMAPGILASSPDFKPQLERVLNWIDHCAVNITAVGICNDRVAWGHHVCQTAFLLRCLLLTRSLTSTQKLRSAIKQAVKLVLPPDIAEPIAKLMDSGEIQFPDKATLSRFHLVLDASYMLYCREAYGHNSTGLANSTAPVRC